jgi:hypothetical protein
LKTDEFTLFIHRPLGCAACRFWLGVSGRLGTCGEGVQSQTIFLGTSIKDLAEVHREH